MVAACGLDIGLALNAKNYVGWDCEVKREFSVGVPKLLMEELDSKGTGAGDRRTVAQAVTAVWNRQQNETPQKRN